MERTAGFDVVILGGGTAGCVLAARLSEDPSVSVGLIEAGPDYGSWDEGRWPEDILDARSLPPSHGWGFEDSNASRARIIGGCSSHNACFVVWGHPMDYDAWSDPTDREWTFETLEPHLRRAERMLRTRIHGQDELGPWDKALLKAADELGYPAPENLNDLSFLEAAAPYPVNAAKEVRWNTAFAYLDAGRGRKNLQILDRTLVDRLVIEDGKASSIRLIRYEQSTELFAKTVILAAGAYGSPAILLRSGVGPEDDLRRVGISPVLPMPGVGRRLKDHCGSWLEFEPTDRLRNETTEHAKEGRVWQSASVLKARSGVNDVGYWDIQLYPWTDALPEAPGAPPSFQFYLAVKLQKVASMGSVRLASANPADLPIVEHGFLAESEDRQRLVEGMKLGRRIAQAGAMRRVAVEVDPGMDVSSNEGLDRFVGSHLAGHFHPVGTCRMGPQNDLMAVTDSRGKLHGVENVYVADASIFPDLPRANTNLTVVAVAERIADSLLDIGPASDPGPNDEGTP
ncbi:MAG TPA: GMC oxidoreductase [Actinomycetota bacterium]|nr:GMC oxidoreductase [Actinomycetota bacterium]